MADNSKSAYVGKIKRGGTMSVTAPVSADGGKGKSSVIKGKDLRTGRGK